jgi:hypothetical protein
MTRPLREADECCHDGQVEKRHNPNKKINVVDEVTTYVEQNHGM